MKVYDVTVIDANTGAYVYEDSEFIYLGNDFLEIQFSKKDNGAIYSFLNKLVGHDYRTNKTCYNRCWEMQITTPNNLSLCDWFDSNAYSRFTHQWNPLDSGFLLSMGYTVGHYNMNITVNVIIHDNSTLTRWKLQVDNGEPEWAIEYAVVPIVTGFQKLGNSTDDYLLMSNGFLIQDPYTNIIQAQGSDQRGLYPAHGYGVQLMLAGDMSGGLYLASYDAESYAKIFDAIREEMTLRFSIEHLNTLGAGDDYRTEYDSILGVFEGEYQNGISMYRKWGTKQWWVCNGTIVDRELPTWFKQGFAMTIITSYYGDFGEDGQWQGLVKNVDFELVPEFVDEYSEELKSPILLRWLGWERYGAWVSPDLFPSAEGEEELRNTIQEIHRRGHSVMLGLSAGIWDTVFESFNETGWYCTMWGRENPKIWNDGSRQVASVSLASETWRQILANNILRLVEMGADGVQLDAWIHEPGDYSPFYDHPLGFGNWYTKELLNTLKEIKEKARLINPEFILASEGITEPLLPYIDLFMSVDLDHLMNLKDQYNQIYSIVPVFSFIYREYSIPLGREMLGYRTSMQGITGSNSPIFLDHAVAFNVVSGAIPEVGDWGYPFPMSIGGMTPNITFSLCLFPSEDNIMLEFMPFDSKPVATGNMEVPTLLSSIWTSNSNSLSFMFVNIGNDSYTTLIEVNMASYGLENEGNYSVFLASNDHFEFLFPSDTPLPLTLNFTILPKSVALLGVDDAGKAPTWREKYEASTATYGYPSVFPRIRNRGIPTNASDDLLINARKAMSSGSLQGSIANASAALLDMASILERFSFLLNETQLFETLITEAKTLSYEGRYFEAATKGHQACEMILGYLFLEVLIDNLHTGKEIREPGWWTRWRYDVLEQHLDIIGYHIQMNNATPLTRQTLNESEMTILFFGAPHPGVTSNEVDAILEYIESGKNLLVLLDNDCEMANFLIAHFGVQALPGYVVAKEHNPNQPGQFSVTSFVEHPVTEGLVSIPTDYIAPLRIVGDAIPLAFTPQETWVSVSPQVAGPFVYMAGALYGTGKVVIISDDLYMGYSAYLKMVANAIDWFSGNYWQCYLPDIAVANVSTSTCIVVPGSTLNISATVTNEGIFDENFNITAFYDLETIETQSVSLDSNTSKTLVFTWNTTGVSKGKYTISVRANISGDIDLADNVGSPADEVTVLSLGHDVAIGSVHPNKTVVGQSYFLSIRIVPRNLGSFLETFNVTAYVNTTKIATFTNVTLISGSSTTLTFFWNTTGWAKGNYIISAYAHPVPNETDIADNTCVDGWVIVAILGDVNGDGIVDIFDCVVIALAFGSTPTSPGWNPNADVNGDNIVDIFDLVVVALHFAETQP